MSHPDLESRARALVDDTLIRAYWESVAHYRTKDLVLIYAAGDSRHPVRAFVRERLPRFMAPKTVTVVPSLPLNANGKVAKSALKEQLRERAG